MKSRQTTFYVRTLRNYVIISYRVINIMSPLSELFVENSMIRFKSHANEYECNYSIINPVQLFYQLIISK